MWEYHVRTGSQMKKQKTCQYVNTHLNFVFDVVPDPKHDDSEDSLRQTGK